jgi:hypothetical protein
LVPCRRERDYDPDVATVRFSAEIQTTGVNPYVEVPKRVTDALAAAAAAGEIPRAVAGRIRVAGTMSAGARGVPVAANLVPVKGRGHRLYVNGGMRAAAGVGVGDTVSFTLRAEADGEVTLPPDLAAALSAGAARTAFQGLTAAHRRELLRYVDDARSPDTRAKRVAATVAQVVGGTTDGVHKGRLDRPLWTCPRCGNSFVTRNLKHSCARHELDDAFAGKPSQIRVYFERLRTTVEALGPVTLVAYRDRIAFMGLVRFAAAVPRQRWLDVELWLARRVDSPRMHKIETLTPRAHIHTVRIAEAHQIDAELAGWLAEAYTIGQRQHLKSTRSG